MEVKLITIGGKHPGQTIPIAGPEFVIGRGEDCQLRPQSDRVSRHHCVIRTGEALAAVRDLGSSNGTFLNGQRLTAEHELKAGDHLRIGPLEFEVQVTVSVSGKRKPKVHNVREAVARTVETASGEEVDVSGWLDDEEEGAADEGAGNTETVTAATNPEAKADQPPQPATPAKEESKPAKPASFLGPDEPAEKVTTENSGEAAADMLRHFLHRKP
jgi:pSer/pThr/pTyr-binding forkhead associated (FHA) protein